MASNVTFEIDDRTYGQLQRVLNPKQLKQAIYQAVNRTTNRGRIIAAKAVLDKMTIPRKYVDAKDNRYAAIKTRIIKGDRPEGRISVRDQQLPMSAFKHSATKAGVRVTIDKSTPAEFFRHAFVAVVRSKRQEELGVSHKGIFVRRKVNAADAQRYFQKNKQSFYRTAKSRAITPKGYAWRLPLGELFGPSVLDFISRDEIRRAVLAGIGNELGKQIDSQVKRFTEGRSDTLAAAITSLDVAASAADPSTDAN